MNNKDHRQILKRTDIEVIKSSGVKISRKEIIRGGSRFVEENQNQLNEAERERRVLNMKKYFKRRGWEFPPKTHHIVTIVHMLNGYYGKEICQHLPKDKLEKAVLRKKTSKCCNAEIGWEESDVAHNVRKWCRKCGTGLPLETGDI